MAKGIETPKEVKEEKKKKIYLGDTDETALPKQSLDVVFTHNKP